MSARGLGWGVWMSGPSISVGSINLRLRLTGTKVPVVQYTTSYLMSILFVMQNKVLLVSTL